MHESSLIISGSAARLRQGSERRAAGVPPLIQEQEIGFVVRRSDDGGCSTDSHTRCMKHGEHVSSRSHQSVRAKHQAFVCPCASFLPLHPTVPLFHVLVSARHTPHQSCHSIHHRDMKVSDYYAVLEVSKSCSQAEVKKA